MGDLVPVRRRRSAVEAFGCPFRYQRIYIDGQDDTGDEALRGRAFHVVALVYVQLLVAAGVAQDAEEAARAFLEGMKLVQVPDHLRDEVGRLMLRWAERFELDIPAFLQAEELVVTDDREFRADLVYARPGELEIVDWKTYFKGLTEDQALKELQVQWYLVEAKKAWPGFARYRFTFDFVRLGWTLSIVFTADEVDALAPVVQTAIDQVERAEATGEFPALPGSHCALCRLACPVVDDALGMVDTRVTSPERAIQVAGQVLAMERRLRLLRKALNGYCQIEGPVTVGGERFAHQESTTLRYPAVPALDVLRDAGLTTDRVTVSRTGLGLGKKFTRVWDALAALATVKRRSAFRHRKAGEQVPDGALDVLEDDDDGGRDD
jgi:hypothetical protein